MTGTPPPAPLRTMASLRLSLLPFGPKQAGASRFQDAIRDSRFVFEAYLCGPPG